MNSSSDGQSDRNMLSDERMDNLLRDFFTLETPSRLNHGFQRREAISSSVSLSKVTPNTESVVTVRRGRGLIVGSVMSVLALGLAVMLQSPDHVMSGAASGNATGNAQSTSSDAQPGPEVLMLVSPQGDSPAAAAAVSEDGVTMEETDTIELKPRR
jgi:hypothetical protein